MTKNIDEHPRLHTIKECIFRLSISRSHLWQLMRSGRIIGIKVGRRGIRIPESEIERFIQEGLSAAIEGGS